jgi:type IV pilus assembly protein PilV
MRSIPKRAPARQSRRSQGGVMLLEALIGLLIFSLGVLALVAMQSVAISNVSNAKYRVEAAWYAEEIMNYIWLDPINVDTKYSYPGGNSLYLQGWVQRVQGLGSSGSPGLPNSVTYPPTITVVKGTIGTGATQQTTYTVNVTLRWKAPNALTPSNHVAQTIINVNQ